MPIIYKCPGCGAAMEFNSTTQKLGCPSCGTQIDVNDYDRMYSQSANTAGQDRTEPNQTGQSYSQQGAGDGRTGFAQNMKIYQCSTCGAQLVADEHTSATFCSFCGNPTLIQDRLQGDFQPTSIIPFTIDRKKAIETYRAWCKRGLLTPKALLRESTIEKISGLYVPYWLYSYSAGTHMEAAAEKVRRETRGDTEYIYTDHFHVVRDVAADFERIPADASEKMPDAAMDKLEPYDYSRITPFAMPYLSGYLSEKYNYTAEQIQNRAMSRANAYITDIARSTIKGYSNVTVRMNDIRMNPTRYEYSLFPVWMLNFRYKDRNFQFMLNGQTGKIVADRPISTGRAVGYGIGIFVLTLIITMIGGMLFI